MLTLYPLSLSELSKADIFNDVKDDALMLKGCYPRVYQQGLDPSEAY